MSRLSVFKFSIVTKYLQIVQIHFVFYHVTANCKLAIAYTYNILSFYVIFLVTFGIQSTVFSNIGRLLDGGSTLYH